MKSEREPPTCESAVRQSLRRILRPDQVTEIRILDASTASYRRPHVESGYFDFDHIKDAAGAVADFDERANIYFLPNPVRHEMLGRACNRLRPPDRNPLTGDAEIVRRWWLLIDADPVRPSGIAASEAEHQEAIARVRKVVRALNVAGWPAPIIADSGNGGHAMFAVDLPVDDGGLVKRCLEALAARFDDDRVRVDPSTHNPARLWRLYGTTNAKGDSTVDRPHRRSRMIRTPRKIEAVSRELLERLAATAPVPVVGQRLQEKLGATQNGFSLATWIVKHGLTVRGPESWKSGQRWVFPACPFDAGHTNSSAYLVELPNGAVAFGCHHNGCVGRGWHELRDLIEPGWRATVTLPRAATAQGGVPLPLALKGLRDAEPWASFPVGELPSPFDRFVEEAAKAIVVDPSFVALPLLAAAAGAVGNAICIELKSSWCEPCCLWTAVIAESGDAKTPAFKAALDPLRQIQRQRHHEYQQRVTQFRKTRDNRKASLKARKRSDSVDNDSHEPRPPLCVRHVVNDTTVEALAPILEQNPRGLLLARDELSGFFRSHNQYKAKGGADTAIWLSMYAGEDISVDRKTPQLVHTHVPRALVSITGTIQPGVLRRVMHREYHENGFFARFMLAWPVRCVGRWTENTITDATQSEVERVFTRLAKLSLNVDATGDPKPRRMRLSGKAKALFVAYVNETAEARAEAVGDDAAAMSKLVGGAARLALIHHLVGSAARGRKAIKNVIPSASMAAGIAQAKWFSNEVLRVYGLLELDGDDNSRQARELVALINRKGGRITPRDLQQASRRYRSSVDIAIEALQQLANANLGRWERPSPGTSGGHPTQVFVLVTEPVGYGGNGNTTSNSTIENVGSVAVTGVTKDSQNPTRPAKKPTLRSRPKAGEQSKNIASLVPTASECKRAALTQS